MLPERPISLLDVSQRSLLNQRCPPSAWSSAGSPLRLTCLSQRQVLQFPFRNWRGRHLCGSGLLVWNLPKLCPAPARSEMPCSPLCGVKQKLPHLISVKRQASLDHSSSPGHWICLELGKRSQPACGTELRQPKGTTAGSTSQTESPYSLAPDFDRMY